MMRDPFIGMSSKSLKTLVDAGWSEDRNMSECKDFKSMINECEEAGFKNGPLIDHFLRQLYNLKIINSNVNISFEHPEYYIDIYADIEDWMKENTNIFPIGEYNGDPIFIGEDGNLYISNYDVLLMGVGGFYKSISDILNLDFMSSKNYIKVIESL